MMEGEARVEINSFVYELEELLQKYFGTDWVWSYKDSDSPLTIYLNSATLDGLWKKEEGQVPPYWKQRRMGT